MWWEEMGISLSCSCHGLPGVQPLLGDSMAAFPQCLITGDLQQLPLRQSCLEMVPLVVQKDGGPFHILSPTCVSLMSLSNMVCEPWAKHLLIYPGA